MSAARCTVAADVLLAQHAESRGARGAVEGDEAPVGEEPLAAARQLGARTRRSDRPLEVGPVGERGADDEGGVRLGGAHRADDGRVLLQVGHALGQREELGARGPGGRRRRGVVRSRHDDERRGVGVPGRGSLTSAAGTASTSSSARSSVDRPSPTVATVVAPRRSTSVATSTPSAAMSTGVPIRSPCSAASATASGLSAAASTTTGELPHSARLVSTALSAAVPDAAAVTAASGVATVSSTVSGSGVDVVHAVTVSRAAAATAAAGRRRCREVTDPR